jgi:hypothetical protein
MLRSLVSLIASAVGWRGEGHSAMAASIPLATLFTRIRYLRRLFRLTGGANNNREYFVHFNSLVFEVTCSEPFASSAAQQRCQLTARCLQLITAVFAKSLGAPAISSGHLLAPTRYNPF